MKDNILLAAILRISSPHSSAMIAPSVNHSFSVVNAKRMLRIDMLCKFIEQRTIQTNGTSALGTFHMNMINVGVVIHVAICNSAPRITGIPRDSTFVRKPAQNAIYCGFSGLNLWIVNDIPRRKALFWMLREKGKDGRALSGIIFLRQTDHSQDTFDIHYQIISPQV